LKIRRTGGGGKDVGEQKDEASFLLSLDGSFQVGVPPSFGADTDFVSSQSSFSSPPALRIDPVAARTEMYAKDPPFWDSATGLSPTGRLMRKVASSPDEIPPSARPNIAEKQEDRETESENESE